MMRLEQEGLAHPIATGGYAVSAFTERDIHTAIEVRGTLEGLAGQRLAAERKLAETDLARPEASACTSLTSWCSVKASRRTIF